MECAGKSCKVDREVGVLEVGEGGGSEVVNPSWGTIRKNGIILRESKGQKAFGCLFISGLGVR